MTTWRRLEDRIGEHIPFDRRPVAVSFLDFPPQGVPKFTGAEPSGCSFWRLAAEGRTVWTEPADHFNCAVGSYTLNIPLSSDRAHETEQTLGLMFEVGYIRPEDVPAIPRLPSTPAAIVYSPLGDAPVPPSVVLFACRPAGAMLLQEAAMRAGKSAALPTLGRPTCMALPAALAHGAVSSLSCIGNRVYTGLSEDELYVAIPGPDVAAVADALDVIASANAALTRYARSRLLALATD
jgi:uncharacterized protein (DUF169 family)